MIEYIYFLPESTGVYSIGISQFGHIPTNAELEIFSVHDKLEYIHAEGSVGVPADAEGALVVGSLQDGLVARPYSSIGPTKNGQNVPNVLVPDGIKTKSYGEQLVYGTSSSAAYLTGLVAILFSESSNTQLDLSSHLLDLMMSKIGDSSVVDGFGGTINTTTSNPTKTPQIEEQKPDVANKTNDVVETVIDEANKADTEELTPSDPENNTSRTDCPPNMNFLMKKSSHELVCVKEETGLILIQRGWGIPYPL